MDKLIVLLGDKPYCEVDLHGTDVTIGSDAGDQIVLADKRVSIRHAELRFHDSQYMLMDLVSETGVWVGDTRVKRVVLSPGIVAAIGPFRLYIDRSLHAAAAAGSTKVGVPTVYAPPAAVRADRPRPTGPAVVPSSARSKTAKGRPAQETNLVARLARLPKPVLFGGFSLVIILILALKVLTTSDEDATSSSTNVSKGSGAMTAPPAPDNNTVIAKHLADGRARIDRGDYATALKEDVDLILLVDRTNAGALALKAEAEEKLARASAATRTADRTSSPAAGTLATEAAASKQAAQLPARPAGAATARADTRAAGGRPQSPDPLASRYDEAVSELRAEHYASAGATLEAIVEEQPRYRDAAQLLVQVRQAEAQRAQAAFGAALALEQDDELAKAASELNRACAMAQAPGGCAAAKARVAEKMQTAGDDAFRRAKIFDGQGRLPEATALYQRAVEMLAADHPNRKIAQERLALLRVRR